MVEKAEFMKKEKSINNSSLALVPSGAALPRGASGCVVTRYKRQKFLQTQMLASAMTNGLACICGASFSKSFVMRKEEKEVHKTLNLNCV